MAGSTSEGPTVLVRGAPDGGRHLGQSRSPSRAVYFISLVIVLWALLDMLRRPRSQLNPIQKLGWSIALVIGWLLPFGILGACLGLAYLGPVRRGLNAGAAAPVEAPWPTRSPSPTHSAHGQRGHRRLVSGPLGRAGDPLVGRGRLDPAHAG